MKTAILIPIRLNSSRLPRKQMLEILKKPLFIWMIERLKYFCPNLEFIVTTTPSETGLIDFCHENKINVFSGDAENVPKRFYQAAQHFRLDNIILLDGDDITCSEEAINIVYKFLEQSYNYVGTKNLPLGMNVSGFSCNYLGVKIQPYLNKIQFQTGCWGSMFDEKDMLLVQFPQQYSEYYEKLRFTLDYQEDADFFSSIINHFGSDFTITDYKKIIDFVITEKKYIINSSLNEEYWKNFYFEKSFENK